MYFALPDQFKILLRRSKKSHSDGIGGGDSDGSDSRCDSDDTASSDSILQKVA